jgi:RNA recognition motif-containing protein
LRIYVGNLEFDFTEEELRQLFNGHGQVESASIVRDRDTQRSKGFAFVEMPSKEEAQAAITALNGKEVQQRALTVTEARPREERSFSNRGGYRPSFRSNNQRSDNQRGDKRGPSKRGRRQRR